MCVFVKLITFYIHWFPDQFFFLLYSFFLVLSIFLFPLLMFLSLLPSYFSMYLLLLLRAPTTYPPLKWPPPSLFFSLSSFQTAWVVRLKQRLLISSDPTPPLLTAAVTTGLWQTQANRNKIVDRWKPRRQGLGFKRKIERKKKKERDKERRKEKESRNRKKYIYIEKKKERKVEKV